MVPDQNILIAGLQFGDEGKGSLTDYFCSQGAELVVRYNGGPQAAHNVRVRSTSGVIHHTFSQFGSGTLRGIPTVLSRFMSVDPPAMLAEASVLSRKLPLMRELFSEKPPLEADVLRFLTLDLECLIITPFHRIVNRIRERLRSQRHGSCGIGVGEAVLDAEKGAPSVRWKDQGSGEFEARLREIQDYKIREAQDLLRGVRDPGCMGLWEDLNERAIIPLFAQKCAEAASRVVTSTEAAIREVIRSRRCVFEGAQGVLLDRDAGFFPYVTPSTTTLKNALDLSTGTRAGRRVGVLRACTVRHGAGPMPSEIEDVSDLQTLRDEDNVDGPWQGILRAGWLDMPALRYALRECRVDELAVTNLDRRKTWKICESYDVLGEKVSAFAWGAKGADLTEIVRAARPILREVGSGEDLIREIESACGLPVRTISSGPFAEDKRSL